MVGPPGTEPGAKGSFTEMSGRSRTSILSTYSVTDNPRGLTRMIFATIGVTILAFSIIGALLLVSRNASDQQRQTKILLFALYFWVLAFAQLIIVAIGYSVMAI